jgi:hypothetical protein
MNTDGKNGGCLSPPDTSAQQKKLLLDKLLKSKNMSVGEAIKAEDAWFKDRVKGEAWASAPERNLERSCAPATLLDGMTAAKAREFRDEKKRKDYKKADIDLKKFSTDQETLASAATAAGISKDLLQYAVKSLPLSRNEDGDRRTIFWRIADDYFRQVDKEDVAMLKNLLRDPWGGDSAFKVPPLGKKYRSQWQDEEKITQHYENTNGTTAITGQGGAIAGQKQLEATGKSIQTVVTGTGRTPSPMVRNKSRGVAPADKGKLVALTSVLSPKPESQDHSELCDICFEGESVEGNEIVFCDSCNVAVHQQCYGIPVVPEGQWLCNKCQEKERTGRQVSCVLCPVRHGAMKPIHPKCCITSNGEPSKKQEFVHLFCSQWIPETFIKAEDTAKMEPVQNVNAISKDRFKLLCSICKQRHGACIQCSHGMCATSFHPLCARAAGLRMEVVGYDGSDDIDLKVYCQKHSKRPVKRQLESNLPAVNLPETTPQRQVTGTSATATTSAAAAANSGAVVVKREGEDGSLDNNGNNKKALLEKKGVDLLAEMHCGQCGALLRQMCTVFGVKVAEVSKDTGVEASKISNLMNKKTPVKEKELETLIGWIRKYAGSLLGKLDKKVDEQKAKAKTEVNDPSPPPSSSKPAEASSASASTEKEKEKETKNGGGGELPKLPKRFQHELGEYMHMYTRMFLEGNKKEKKAPAPAGSIDLDRGLSEEMALALACSPESETMGELFVMQHELAKQMVINRQNMKRLFSKISAQLPEETKFFAQRDQDMKKVNKFIEETKEAKRLLKRERRAEQQKENLAAAEAAVAQSTRYSAGRHNFAPSAAQVGGSIPASAAELVEQIPNIYTKDANGQDVIYDKFSIQKTDQDLLCSVCGQGHSEEPNQIVFCEMCDLAVHQKCYGISKIPEGEWLCWPCKEYEEECLKQGKPKSAIRKPRYLGSDYTALDKTKCVCCPVKRGAFKKTVDGDWAHIACAMWNRIKISDLDVVNSIGSVKDAILGSQQLTCSLCNEKGGAIIKCNYGHCQTFFHPLCARAAGYVMPIKNGEGTSASVRVYCGRHGHLVQQQQASPAKHQAQMPQSLIDHIQWLETNYTRLRKTRQELERLRLISDVLIKREKTKTNLLKGEQAYILKGLQRPKIAKDFEDKMKDPDYMKKVLTQTSPADNQLKRKGWYQQYERTKYGRQPQQPQPVVERERVMTIDQAKATNVKLPPGYLYVPLDYSAGKK